MKIIADTPTLFSPEEGEKYGIKIIPSCTIIDGEVYKDYIDIGNEAFIERIENGSVPTTSQPAIGDILETFEENDEEITDEIVRYIEETYQIETELHIGNQPVFRYLFGVE